MNTKCLYCYFFRDATFTFDAMSLYPATRFCESDDLVAGLDKEDRGKGGDMASLLLVVMLHGVYEDWKQPIGYFPISCSMEVSKMKAMILEGIHLSHEAGIRVRQQILYLLSNQID